MSVLRQAVLEKSHSLTVPSPELVASLGELGWNLAHESQSLWPSPLSSSSPLNTQANQQWVQYYHQQKQFGQKTSCKLTSSPSPLPPPPPPPTHADKPLTNKIYGICVKSQQTHTCTYLGNAHIFHVWSSLAVTRISFVGCSAMQLMA